MQRLILSHAFRFTKAETHSSDEISQDYKVTNSLRRLYYYSCQHFYFDNYFSTASVVQDLFKNKTYACSTLCYNRKPILIYFIKHKIKTRRVPTQQNQNLICLTRQAVTVV